MAIGAASMKKGDALGAVPEVPNVAPTGEPPTKLVGEPMNASFRTDGAGLGAEPAVTDIAPMGDPPTKLVGEPRNASFRGEGAAMGERPSRSRDSRPKKRDGSGAMITPLIGEPM